MTYNPELVKQLLGNDVADLFDGTINIIPAIDNKVIYGNLKVGDILEFKFKDDINFEPRQFVISWNK